MSERSRIENLQPTPPPMDSPPPTPPLIKYADSTFELPRRGETILLDRVSEPTISASLDKLLKMPADRDYLLLTPKATATTVKTTLEAPKLQAGRTYPRLPYDHEKQMFQPELQVYGAGPTVAKAKDGNEKKPWQPDSIFEDRVTLAHAQHAHWFYNPEQYPTVGRDDAEDEQLMEEPSSVTQLQLGRLTDRHYEHVSEWAQRREYWKKQAVPADETADEDTIDASEGFDVFPEPRSPDEKFFDGPDEPIGIFNKAEVDLYVDRERQKARMQMSLRGATNAQINQAQHDAFNAWPAELNRRREEAEEAQVRSGKMLPPRIPTDDPDDPAPSVIVRLPIAVVVDSHGQVSRATNKRSVDRHDSQNPGTGDSQTSSESDGSSLSSSNRRSRKKRGMD